MKVSWPLAGEGRTVRFTRVNGAAEALKKVAAELVAMPEETRRYMAKMAGTFNWRPILGITRPSMHSFGMSIDFEFPPAVFKYWRWNIGKDGSVPPYPTKVLSDPHLRRIVEAFERHGFVWGGKWRHFDTMHFEYRPELAPRRARGE